MLRCTESAVVGATLPWLARDVQSAGPVQLSCWHQTTRTMVPMTTFTPSPPPAAAAIVVAAKLPAR